MNLHGAVNNKTLKGPGLSGILSIKVRLPGCGKEFELQVLSSRNVVGWQLLTDESDIDEVDFLGPRVIPTEHVRSIEYQDSQIVPSVTKPLSHEQRTNLFTTQRARE